VLRNTENLISQSFSTTQILNVSEGISNDDDVNILTWLIFDKKDKYLDIKKK
jgi:hypothetical protein